MTAAPCGWLFLSLVAAFSLEHLPGDRLRGAGGVALAIAGALILGGWLWWQSRESRLPLVPRALRGAWQGIIVGGVWLLPALVAPEPFHVSFGAHGGAAQRLEAAALYALSLLPLWAPAAAALGAAVAVMAEPASMLPPKPAHPPPRQREALRALLYGAISAISTVFLSMALMSWRDAYPFDDDTSVHPLDAASIALGMGVPGAALAGAWLGVRLDRWRLPLTARALLALRLGPLAGMATVLGTILVFGIASTAEEIVHALAQSSILPIPVPDGLTLLLMGAVAGALLGCPIALLCRPAPRIVSASPSREA